MIDRGFLPGAGRVRVWPNDARAAFNEAEALMKPRLLDDLAEREGFQNHERTHLIFHRQAQALLGLK